MSEIPAPIGMLVELTHRCPLACPYCSNPLELARRADELDEAVWRRVLSEAAALGVLQIHFSGGEPTLRPDLASLIAHAATEGLYTNLITAGQMLDEGRWQALVEAGLDHVQVSFQDSEAEGADRIAGLEGAYVRKRRFAAMVRAAGLPLTVNAVMHRQNLAHLPAMIALAVELDARRIEIAHVQYYGWALRNRAALMPDRGQVEAASALVERERERLKGILVIDHVAPDYHAERPKSCLGGWGRSFLAVAPDGAVLPCHAARTLPDMTFPSVRETSLADAWYRSDAFNRYRGTDWMREPCRSCERREIDWGGCRCQALALAGNSAATDPTCGLSPHRHVLVPALEGAALPAPTFVYRPHAAR